MVTDIGSRLVFKLRSEAAPIGPMVVAIATPRSYRPARLSVKTDGMQFFVPFR